MQIKTNNLNRAAENSFSICNNAGTVLFSQDNFEDDKEYNIPVKLENGCYTFLFSDKMEDGVSIHWWNRVYAPDEVGTSGKIRILAKDGSELYNFHSSFGQELLLNFMIGEFE